MKSYCDGFKFQENNSSEMHRILESMIEHLSINFFNIVIQSPTKEERQLYSKPERIDFGIHCNYVKDEMIRVLQLHDFEEFQLSCENLANWLLRYAHALCEYSVLSKPTLKLIHELDAFRPRKSFLEALERLERIKPDLYDEHLNKTETIAKSIHQNFIVLLELEDVEVLLEYAPLVQNGINIQFLGDRSFKANLKENELVKIKDIVTPDLDEVVIVEQSRKEEYKLIEILIPENRKDLLIDKRDPLPYGTVKKFSSSHIHFKLSKDSDWMENLNMCDLVFRPSRTPVRYQHNALQLLKKNAHLQDYLFPRADVRPMQTSNELNLEFINKDVATNPEQLEAVTNIVMGPNPNAPYIIFGPPGTGKTTTIVESMLQLRLQKPKSRILVAAGSNAACDTIALRLCEIFNNNTEIQQHLENDILYPMLRIYSRSVLPKIRQIPEELVRRSNLEWVSGKIGDPSLEYIHRYGIVLATLCTVGKLVRGDVGKLFQHDESDSNHFTHVFIDEAAASSEPETLIGIMGIKNGVHAGSCRVILSGDHKQLGPVIKSDEAKKLGLDKSLMERLLECDCYALNDKGDYDRSLQMRLRRNYRSHPEIVRLYNHLYYDNELIAMKAVSPNEEKQWSVLRNSKFPIAFQVVNGVMRKNRTASSCNMLEIKVLCVYVKQLLKIDKTNENDIGVVTPYKLQCELIKERFKERNWNRIEVGSVENFQGREKLIIIASMVRSNNNLGFVRCPRRLNVLLSRPKSLLIILGDPKTLSGTQDLKFIINECKINGNYLEEKKMKTEEDGNPASTITPNATKTKTKSKKSLAIENKTKKQTKANMLNALKLKKPNILKTNKDFAIERILRKTATKDTIKKNKYEKETKSINLSFLAVKRRFSL